MSTQPLRLPKAPAHVPASTSLSQLKTARDQLSFLHTHIKNYDSLLSALDKIKEDSDDQGPLAQDRWAKILEPHEYMGFRTAKMVDESGLLVHLGDGYHVVYTVDDAYNLALRRRTGINEAITRYNNGISILEQQAKQDYGIPEEWQINDQEEILNEEGLPLIEIHEEMSDEEGDSNAKKNGNGNVIEEAKIEEIIEPQAEQKVTKNNSRIKKEPTEFSKGFAAAIAREKPKQEQEKQNSDPEPSSSKTTKKQKSVKFTHDTKEGDDSEPSFKPEPFKNPVKDSVVERPIKDTVVERSPAERNQNKLQKQKQKEKEKEKEKEKKGKQPIKDKIIEHETTDLADNPTRNALKNTVIDENSPRQIPMQANVIERDFAPSQTKSSSSPSASLESFSKAEIDHIPDESTIKIDGIVDSNGYSVHSMEDLLERSRRQQAEWGTDDEDAIDDDDDDDDYEDEDDFSDGLSDIDEAFQQRSIALEYMRRRNEITSQPNHGPLSGEGFFESDNSKQEFIRDDQDIDQASSRFKEDRFQNAQMIIPTLANEPSDKVKRGGGHQLSDLGLDGNDNGDDGLTEQEREHVRLMLEKISTGDYSTLQENESLSNNQVVDHNDDFQEKPPAVIPTIKESVIEKAFVPEKEKEPQTSSPESKPKRVSRFRAQRNG